MSEPEFLPEWYRVRLRRSRRRRAVARATVALSLLAAGAVALSPERAPAVVTEGASRTTSDPRATAATRRTLPTNARRALRALHDLIPTGVEVSAVTFRNDAGVTLMELQCAGEHSSAADELVSALRVELAQAEALQGTHA